jgi:hypothetical protein
VGAGKSTTAVALAGRPPDLFVLVQGDNPPEHSSDRRSQIELWGRLVWERMTAGQNVMLDCDLQTEEEASELTRIARLEVNGPEVLLVRLGLSLGTAIDRKKSLPEREVAHYWRAWGAPPISWERRLETDGLDSDEVKRRVLEAIREKWP